MLRPTLPRVVLAVVCGFCLILIAAWLSGSTGEVCKETQTGHEQCTPYNLAPFILIQIREGLHAIEGIITALATIAIAWFTWTLWQSNEKMWSVANASLELTKLDMGADLVLKTAVIEGITYIPTAQVELINIGRTKAIGVTMWCSIGVRPLPLAADAFPSDPDVPKSIIDVGPQRTIISRFSAGNPLQENHKYAIANGTAALFVVGEATYTDVFREIKTTPVRLAIGGIYGALADGKLAICEEGNTKSKS
jgi:hypothetical protein